VVCVLATRHAHALFTALPPRTFALFCSLHSGHISLRLTTIPLVLHATCARTSLSLPTSAARAFGLAPRLHTAARRYTVRHKRTPARCAFTHGFHCRTPGTALTPYQHTPLLRGLTAPACCMARLRLVWCNIYTHEPLLHGLAAYGTRICVTIYLLLIQAGREGCGRTRTKQAPRIVRGTSPDAVVVHSLFKRPPTVPVAYSPSTHHRCWHSFLPSASLLHSY